MRDNPQVLLSKDTMECCEHIATKRNIYERQHGHGVKNPNIQADPDKSYRTHLVGAMAEAAVLLYYGSDCHEMTYREDGKGGREHDLTILGHTVEVKGTERPAASRLIVPKGRLRESEVYFLVRVDVDTCVCEILGYVTWRQVLIYNEKEHAKPGVLRGKNIYTVRESDLRKARVRHAE